MFSRYQFSSVFIDRITWNRNGRALTLPALVGFEWCRHEDLNPEPTDYKSVALPVELCGRNFEAGASPLHAVDRYVTRSAPRYQASALLLKRPACRSFGSLRARSTGSALVTSAGLPARWELNGRGGPSEEHPPQTQGNPSFLRCLVTIPRCCFAPLRAFVLTAEADDVGKAGRYSGSANSHLVSAVFVSMGHYPTHRSDIKAAIAAPSSH